jgi:hypothetical protein
VEAAVGAAALGSVLAAGALGGDAAKLRELPSGFLVAAVLALVGAMSALRVPDDEAAETMHLQVRAKRSQRGDRRAAEVG